MNKESRIKGQLKRTIEWQKITIKSRDEQIIEMQLLIDSANKELKKLRTQTSSFDIVIPSFEPSDEGVTNAISESEDKYVKGYELCESSIRFAYREGARWMQRYFKNKAQN